jgi:sugar phosphate permease
MDSSLWRARVFSCAWILYAGYYICRKDIGAAQSSPISSFAVALACFGAMYAVGQLVGGALADRFGARSTALAGAGISVLCTAALVLCNRPALVLIFQLGNGFGQGFGWPSLIKLLGSWFRRGERDIVLSWWSTSYILGGLLASSLTEWLILNTAAFSHTRLHLAYLASSGLLLVCALFFINETRGLPDIPQFEEHEAAVTPVATCHSLFSNRSIRSISGAYFFLKMTRYTLLFWLPNYLISDLGFRAHAAGHMSSYFELFGFLGPLAVGYTLQRFLKRRMLALGAGMLFGLAFLCLLHPMLASNGTLGMVTSIACMGILVHGADILISGMAVLEAVPAELQGRAAGLVNAVGSVGQALSPLLITLYVSHLGWTRLFDLFVFFALAAGALCAFGARGETHVRPRRNRSAIQAASFPV